MVEKSSGFCLTHLEMQLFKKSVVELTKEAMMKTARFFLILIVRFVIATPGPSVAQIPLEPPTVVEELSTWASTTV